MNERRPNPDELLDRLKQDEARALRGKLKIFFGASAGVGKTFAMLSAGQQLRAQGIDVVIGVVETHGRSETAALVNGLEQIPPRLFEHRERTLPEFNLDAALARRPQLILVDELAHSNLAGSRHPKRWQDIEELLGAGIDVYTTVNVQHIESLNDIVGGITGIRVWETVPDHVFDAADEVVLVDLPPDELLQRLKQGKVYLPQQAERAINHFFRKGNLLALRELALRRVADRVDDDMRAYRRDQAVGQVWQTRESLLACIGPQGGSEKIIRSAARLAAKLDMPWHAIYVETPMLQRLSSHARRQILKTVKLAQELGAETATLPGSDAVETVIAYARTHNLARILVGRDHRWNWWRRSFADRLARIAPDIEITQIAGAVDTAPFVRATTEKSRTAEIDWRGYGISALACVGATLLASLLYPHFELTNIAMIFLLVVVLVATRHGRGPATLAAFLSVGAFDFFFVPPRFTFAVSDAQYLVTFAVMLVVGLIIGQLTANLKYQARVAINREERARALSGLARELSGALLLEQIAEIANRYVESSFNAKVAVVLADQNDKLSEPIAGSAPLIIDSGILHWVFDRGEPAGLGTDTLPAGLILYLPLRAPMRIRGVLAVEPRSSRWLLIPEQRRQLETFAALIAIAVERIHYVDIAQTTTVQIESERLRNSLLSSLSHDLRTPLTAQSGLAETLLLTKPELSAEQTEMVRGIRDATAGMTTLVNNLLDMSRLQAGAVKLNRQWQPLEEVLGAVLASTRPLLKNHVVELHLDPHLPLIEFDAVLMERVFENILDNMHKYTPPGTRITISAQAKDAVLEIVIEDNGPGFALGSEEEIFKKFSRGEVESSTRGVGLGLAICRAIVEAHRGRIRAERVATGGARFVIALPLGNPPAVTLE